MQDEYASKWLPAMVRAQLTFGRGPAVEMVRILSCDHDVQALIYTDELDEGEYRCRMLPSANVNKGALDPGKIS